MIDLKITQQFAKIGIEKHDVQFQLRQHKPNLDIKQVPADFKMEYEENQLTIDYTPMLESLGYGGIEYMSRSYVQKNREEFLSNLGETVQEGYSMGAIENNLSIGEILFQNTAPQQRDIQIVSLAPINISFEPGVINATVELGGVEGYLDYGKITVEDFVFPKVKVFLEQEPYIKIESVGQVIDVNK